MGALHPKDQLVHSVVASHWAGPCLTSTSLKGRCVHLVFSLAEGALQCAFPSSIPTKTHFLCRWIHILPPMKWCILSFWFFFLYFFLPQMPTYPKALKTEKATQMIFYWAKKIKLYPSLVVNRKTCEATKPNTGNGTIAEFNKIPYII